MYRHAGTSAAAAAAAAVASGSTATHSPASSLVRAVRHLTTSTRPALAPSLSPPTGGSSGGSAAEMNEDRIARWCRRLWDLTQKSAGSVAPNHLAPQLYTTAAGAATNAASPLNAATGTGKDGTAAETTGELVLSRLRLVIRGDQGRIPSVIVESVWAAFDVLVPPIVQDSVSDPSITPQMEENFFLFISTLNELNFDVQAVAAASEQLASKLEAYRALERQAAAPAEATAARGELSEQLMKAKGEVMQYCFEARNAGSPLYYTWLRHTAAMSDGLRRLMHFRKLVHFFESLCKRRIKKLMPPRSAAPAAAGAAPSSSTSAELSKWRSRLIEVGLIDGALSLLFHDFFSKEYLVMEELMWHTTPPSMLDLIMQAESVHPFVRGLEDMRSRLQPAHHRHLFAFLHPAVVEEPLIAVQVALTHGIASSVDQILGRPTPLADPANASEAARRFRNELAASATAASESAGSGDGSDGNVNTAIFYSINSAQSALRGMDMGNRLIKRVVQEVKGTINASRQARSLTPIHTFSTLSPIPLYVSWLAGEVAALPPAGDLRVSGVFGRFLTPAEGEAQYMAPLREAVAGFVLRHPTVLPAEAAAVTRAAAAAKSPSAGADQTRASAAAANVAVLQYLVHLFRTASEPPSPSPSPQQPWWADHAFTTAIEVPLLRSVATYLCTAKRGRGGRIRDPVGNFHVSNGATVFRLNFLGNTTPQGSRESACVMVNYWYDLPNVSTNVAQYEVHHTVSLGEPVKALLGAEVAPASLSGNSPPHVQSSL